MEASVFGNRFFSVGFLDAFFDFRFNGVFGVVELADALAQSTGQFGDLSAAEEQQDDQQDADHFGDAQAQDQEKESEFHLKTI